ncbi:MAG TPA: flagellar hook-length control protein FliK, partial [Acetobacteraceae bacterium]|nr:flagellar hook-length control protein FliK [Acetobacteraceae bacterium]
TPDVTAKAVAQVPDAQADAAQDGGEDAAIVPVETPGILAALPQTPENPQTATAEKPQAATPPEKKDDKDPQAAPAVNDNDVLVQPPLTAMLLAQPVAAAPSPPQPAAAAPSSLQPVAAVPSPPQPAAAVPSPPQPAAAAPSPPQPAAAAPTAAAPKADAAPPLATGNATPPNAGANIPQPQPAAAQSKDATGEAADAAVAQQAAAAPDAAGAKAKPADLKKALDDVKSATVKTASAKAADGTTPAPNAAPAHTDTHADANTDSGQADTRAADAAAQPPTPAAAPANAAPQPGIMPVVAAPPPAHTAAAQTLAPMPQPALLMPQYTPNMPTPNMNGLAVDIAAKSLGGTKQFDIRLDPPELGRVEVRLSIDATGKAQAHLTADQPQTLDLLQKDASTLTRALRDAGLNVNQDGLNFSLRSQQQQAGNERQHRPSGGRAVRSSFAAPASLQPVAAAAASSGRSGRGLLDIKV